MAGDNYMPEGATPYFPEGATPLQQPQDQGYPESQPITRAIGNSPIGGLFNIPVLGGILRNLSSGTEAYGRGILGAGYELGRAGVGNIQGDKAYSPQGGVYGINPETGNPNTTNPFLSNEDLTKMQNPLEMLGRTANMMGNAATFSNPLATVKSLPAIAKAPLNPIETLGKLRNVSLGKNSVPTSQMGKDLLENLTNSKYFQNAPGIAQKAAKGRLGEFLANLNPIEGVPINQTPTSISPNNLAQSLLEEVMKNPKYATSPIDNAFSATSTGQVAQPAQTLLNKIYQNLPAFEKMGGAYAKGGTPGGTAIGQGTNLVSHTVRDYLTQNSPLSAKLLTKTMSGLYNTPGVAKWAAGGIGAGGAGSLLFKLLSDNLNPQGTRSQ